MHRLTKLAYDSEETWIKMLTLQDSWAQPLTLLLEMLLYSYGQDMDSYLSIAAPPTMHMKQWDSEILSDSKKLEQNSTGMLFVSIKHLQHSPIQ